MHSKALLVLVPAPSPEAGVNVPSTQETLEIPGARLGNGPHLQESFAAPLNPDFSLNPLNGTFDPMSSRRLRTTFAGKLARRPRADRPLETSFCRVPAARERDKTRARRLPARWERDKTPARRLPARRERVRTRARRLPTARERDKTRARRLPARWEPDGTPARRLPAAREDDEWGCNQRAGRGALTWPPPAPGRRLPRCRRCARCRSTGAPGLRSRRPPRALRATAGGGWWWRDGWPGTWRRRC